MCRSLDSTLPHHKYSISLLLVWAKSLFPALYCKRSRNSAEKHFYKLTPPQQPANQPTEDQKQLWKPKPVLPNHEILYRLGLSICLFLIPSHDFLKKYLFGCNFCWSMWTLSCGIWDLVPWPGIEPRHWGAWSLSHWTTREVPLLMTLMSHDLSWNYTILFAFFTFQPQSLCLCYSLCLAFHSFSHSSLKHSSDVASSVRFHSCCCSVTQLCLALCCFMDCSTPGFPVLHHLLELAQTSVHWFDDAI